MSEAWPTSSFGTKTATMGSARRGFVEGQVTRRMGSPLCSGSHVRHQRRSEEEEEEEKEGSGKCTCGVVVFWRRYPLQTASHRSGAGSDFALNCVISAERTRRRIALGFSCIDGAAPRSAATMSNPPISSGINAGGRAGRLAPCRRRPIAAASASISPVPNELQRC